MQLNRATIVLAIAMLFNDLIAVIVPVSARMSAQEITSVGNGLRKLSSPRLDLITDLPIDDELKSWPALYDQAIEQWRVYFSAQSIEPDEFRSTVHVIGDRVLFNQSGLLNNVSAFDEGYQLQNRLFLVEQPSVYYRRHLFLHEATHWVMARIFDGAGPPWIMEGMADMMGTHRLVNGQLTLNVIPTSFRDVPQWGRFRILHDSMEQGMAPSLDQIMNFSNDRTNHLVRYAWSWAACVFFANHPDYREDFFASFERPLGVDDHSTQRLKSRLKDKMPQVMEDWNGFVSEFDFGFDPLRSIVRTHLADKEKPIVLKDLSREAVRIQLDTSKGWQSTRIRLKRGETVHIRATGEYTVKQFSNAESWKSQPQGLTLEYIEHAPLGCVVAAIVPTLSGDKTLPWKSHVVGKELLFTPSEDGLLILKINERAGELFDNDGELEIVVEASSKAAKN